MGYTDLAVVRLHGEDAVVRLALKILAPEILRMTLDRVQSIRGFDCTVW